MPGRLRAVIGLDERMGNNGRPLALADLPQQKPRGIGAVMFERGDAAGCEHGNRAQQLAQLLGAALIEPLDRRHW